MLILETCLQINRVCKSQDLVLFFFGGYTGLGKLF